MKIALNLNVLDKWISLTITQMAYYTCIEGRDNQRDNTLVLWFNSIEERDIAYDTIVTAIIECKYIFPNVVIDRTVTKPTKSKYDMEWEKKLIVHVQNGMAGMANDSSFKVTSE